MAVYFVKCKDSDFVKIGYAANPTERLKKLQTGCPFQLILYKTFDGSQKTEAELHKIFAGYRKNGEWFLLNKKILSYIKSLDKKCDIVELINRNIDELTMTDSQIRNKRIDELKREIAVFKSKNSVKKSFLNRSIEELKQTHRLKITLNRPEEEIEFISQIISLKERCLDLGYRSCPRV